MSLEGLPWQNMHRERVHGNWARTTSKLSLGRQQCGEKSMHPHMAHPHEHARNVAKIPTNRDWVCFRQQ